MFGRVKALIIKEILSVWRDKKSRTVLIVPPLVQLLIFAFAATLDVTHATIAVLNHDSGKASFELIQRFKGSPIFHNLFYLSSEKEIQEAIDTQKALMVIHIDDQFSRNLYALKPANVQLILDGRKSNSAQIVEGYATNIIQQFNKEYAKEKNLSALPVALISRNWFNPNLLYYWFNVPNLCGILSMLISFIVTALSVARERELGTFDQLLVSPMQPFEILLGKTIPAILISLVEATFIIIVAVFVIQIPFRGSLLSLYGSLFVFTTSIVGIGLFVSSLSKNQQQAILGSFLFISPALLLSGYATPIENMPHWLQVIDYVNPLRYFLIIVKGVFLKNMPAWMVWSYTWPIAIIAFFTFTGAYLFFKRRLE